MAGVQGPINAVTAGRSGVSTSSSSMATMSRNDSRLPKDVDDVETLLGPLDVDGFRNLDKRHTSPDELPGHCGAWPSDVNMYEDILPCPRTRIKLATFNGDPSTDYINANYVRDRAGNFAWIAAQGPMDSTVNDFWRMIWEKKVPVIVMLTRTVEDGVFKCAKYLPPAVDTPQVHGLFEVTLNSFGAFPPDQTRQSCFRSFLTIRLYKRDGTFDERKVVHFWFNAWPDHGRPIDAAQMLALATSIRKLRTSHGSKVQRPTLVHCSSGVGRTGSFIAMIDILDAVHHGEKVDILSIIARIRNDRCHLVNSVLQYEFLWDAAYEYICLGNNVLKHKVKTLPGLEPGTKPGFTLSGPKSVHSGDANDELLNAFFVKSVKPGSVAEKAGLSPGDRIEEISHAAVPIGRDGTPMVFRLKGKTLGVVTAELLRAMATRKPVHLKVSKQKIAMEAQQQLRDEEEYNDDSRYDDNDDNTAKMQRRIEEMKALYRREKETAEDKAEESEIIDAVEEFDEEREREYEERVLREMEELATEKAEELIQMDSSVARMNSIDLKNQVTKYVGKTLGVHDEFLDDNVRLDMPAVEERSPTGKQRVSFTSIDQQHWNDSEFLGHMLGNRRTSSYTQATASGKVSATFESDVYEDTTRELGPTEAEAAGVPRTLFRQLDTDHDGMITVAQLRQAEADGLLETITTAATTSRSRRGSSRRGSHTSPRWSTTSNVAARLSETVISMPTSDADEGCVPIVDV